MFLQQLEEELVISMWKRIFFSPSFISGVLRRRLQLLPRIESQEGSGWLFAFPRKVQVGCFFIPGRFRLAVCFPDDDCAVLSEELLTYVLCRGETPSVFGGVGLGEGTFFSQMCSVNANANLLLSLGGDFPCLKSLRFLGLCGPSCFS